MSLGLPHPFRTLPADEAALQRRLIEQELEKFDREMLIAVATTQQLPGDEPSEELWCHVGHYYGASPGSTGTMYIGFVPIGQEKYNPLGLDASCVTRLYRRVWQQVPHPSSTGLF